MKVYFIRHGRTPGNLEKRYVGKTDESLCKDEITQLAKYQYPKVDKVYTSCMKRCKETARLIYPNLEVTEVENLQECDFGRFEYKNYEELKERCRASFLKAITMNTRECAVAFVVHGGTIMAILDAFSSPHKDYYDWQIGNGEGFAADLFSSETGVVFLKNIKKIKK